MKIHACIVLSGAVVLAALAAPVAARDATPSLPAVEADRVHYVVDCQHRSLPSQREVGEWTGQHNFSQVYDTRERLMGEIGRACQRHGIDQVRLVSRNDTLVRGRYLAVLASRNGH